MASTWNGATLTWELTAGTTGALTAATGADQFKSPIVRKIVYMPDTSSDDLVFQNSASVNAIVLKAGATDTSPVHIDFGERGKRVHGLKCTTNDGGSVYVYLA